MNQYFSFNKFAGLFTAAIIFFTASAAAQVVLISPANQSAKQGDTVSVRVNVENFTGLKVYSIKVSYNLNVLKCISVSKLDFLSAQASTFFFSMVDSAAGRVQCDEAILGTGSSSGSGGLFEMKFIGKNLGVSPMDFFSLDLRNIDNQQLTYTHQNGSVTIQNTSSAEKESDRANRIALMQNYPNPVAGGNKGGATTTKIRFTIPADAGSGPYASASLTVYDILGREISRLVNEEKAPGEYEVDFNTASLPAGIYIYELRKGNNSLRRKMIITR